MKNRYIFILPIIILVLLTLLASCTSTTTTQSTTTKTSATPIATSTSAVTHWWDSLGKPTYGGTLIHRTDQLTSILIDPADVGVTGKYYFWLDNLFAADWVLDRDTFSFTTAWIPQEYMSGWLAESWEQTDPLSITMRLRQGIHWQNKSPVNGRDFTADDVKFNYDRMCGIGSGFTVPNPQSGKNLSNIKQVDVNGRYTVIFKFKQASALQMNTLLVNQFGMVAPEWVALGTSQQTARTDWETVVGTGAWMLKDFVSGTSLTYEKNPDYWGYDERYPENRLPYADTYKELAIPDWSTTIAAIRTGKIDLLVDRSSPSLQQTDALMKDYPEVKVNYWVMDGYCIELRCDTAPFNNLKVRTALQMAVDVKTIAKTLYGGKVDEQPVGLITPIYKDWVTPFNKWSNDLQQEYSFNPTQAKALLADAGYPNGFQMEVIAPSDFDITLLQAEKSYFKDISVDMTIEAMDMPTFIGMAFSGKVTKSTLAPDSGMAGDPITNMNKRATGYVMNYTHCDDPVYDEMYNRLKVAGTIDEAKSLVNQMNIYSLQQHWSVNVCNGLTPIIWQPWIKGYKGEYIGTTYLFSRLWVDQDLKKSMGH